MNLNRIHQMALAICLISLARTPSHAAYVPDVAIQSFSSEYATTTDSRRATNLVNDVGMFGDIVTPVPNGSAWLTKTSAAQVHTNFVVFDLGAVRPVQSMIVWNYNEAAVPATVWMKRGVALADISISSDGSAFTTNLANATFNAAPGLFTNNFAQTFDFGGVMARFVRINIRTNHGELGTPDVAVGLNKVRFIDTNVPPRLTFASLNYSSNKVMATFSESVTASTATNIANYSIRTEGTNSATILSANFDLYNNRVALQTTTLSNSSYTLVVSGVAAVSDGTAITNNSAVTIEKEFSIWLKADAGVTSDGSGFVTQWADQSGNANNALPPDPVYQPTLVSDAINGKPALHFTAASTNFLQIAPAPTLMMRNDYSIVAVVRVTDMTSPQPTELGIINKMNPVTGQPMPFDLHVGRVNASTGNIRCYRGQGFINTPMNGLTNIAPGQSFIVTCVLRGTTGNQFLNGAYNQRVTSLIGINDGNRPIGIGSREGFGVRMNGDIAEIMLIRGALADSERIGIHDYLGAKYGIPVVNLNITEQPTPVTKLEGQTATFSVAALASEPTISYQWQRYGTNLPNATNATYTTPLLTLADNNAPYRVVLSIPNTNVVSEIATLTVLPDTEKPTVTSAGRAIWDSSTIVVLYSETVIPVTAANPANYALDNGATVTSASMGDAPNKVMLTTTMANGGTYLLSIQNVRDLFNNAIVPIQTSLAVYPASTALWLKADAGVTADESGLVSQWDDQSGNNNHVSQTLPANMPTLVPNAFNGQPALNFVASNISYLYALSSPSLEIRGDMSIIAVARFQSFTNFNALVAKTTGSQPASYDFYTVNGNNGRPRFLRGNGTANTSSTATLPATLNVPQIVSVTLSGTNAVHFLDGSMNGSSVIFTNLIADNNGDPVVIGSRSDLGTRMNGDIAEIMVFGSALSQVDMTALHNYVGAKYGILVGSAPKITVMAASAGNITFSWPTTTVPMILESTANLTPANWTTVTNTVSNSGGTNFVTLPITGGERYFRLHKP